MKVLPFKYLCLLGLCLNLSGMVLFAQPGTPPGPCLSESNQQSLILCDGTVKLSVITANTNGQQYTYRWNGGEDVPDSSIIVDSSGIYSVNVRGSFGCSDNHTFYVNGSSNLLLPDPISQVFFSRNLRPGFLSNIRVLATNYSCIPLSGKIYLVIDSVLEFTSASPYPEKINGDTLFWSFQNIFSDQLFAPLIQVLVPATVPIGNTLCFYTKISPDETFPDLRRNINEYCRIVTGSYDPNDISVNPPGVCQPNYVLNKEPLTYTVRFQNTGTDTAFSVVIVDTLQPGIPLNSIKVIASSHNHSISFKPDNNVIKFRFHNILLPDSNTNEKESHGYLIFSVLPQLPSGTTLQNSAAIYFDYNEPVITNMVENRVVDTIPKFNDSVIVSGDRLTAFQEGVNYQWYRCHLNGQNEAIEGETGPEFLTPPEGGFFSVHLTGYGCLVESACIEVKEQVITGISHHSPELRIYPNPATGSINIMSVAGYLQGFELLSPTGQIIQQGKLQGNSIETIRLPESPGFYFLRAQLYDGNWANFKVINNE